jgi:NAD(P)-dependent dehydrogenase (short-subunit alcohol dehydrogenase family)
MTSPQNILITGSNSGFGRLTSETLARSGHRVFASMRDLTTRNAQAAEELRNFKSESGGSIHPVEIDVTSDDSVARGVAAALEQAGHLDVAINNAGLGAWGLTESFTPAQLTTLFDLNVGGSHRINRAVLPGMRQRGAGLLVHVTSMVGRMIFPAMGTYCAAKFALEALAEAYHYELAMLGVDSIMVEPGAAPTKFMAAMLMPGDAERAAGYGPLAQLPEQMAAGLQHMLTMNPQDVADAILRLIETPAGSRPLRTVVDAHPEGVDAINQVTAQVQTGTLTAMGFAGMLQVATRSQAS